MVKTIRQDRKMNKVLTIKKIEFIAKNIPIEKTPARMTLLLNSKHMSKKIMSTLEKLIQKIENVEILCNSAYETRATLISKPDRHIDKKEKLYIIVPHEHWKNCP